MFSDTCFVMFIANVKMYGILRKLTDFKDVVPGDTTMCCQYKELTASQSMGTVSTTFSYGRERVGLSTLGFLK